MPKRTRSYEASLLADLRDPVQAAAYLNASLEEPEQPDAEALFLLALHHVAKAHGIADLAARSKLNRESLHRTLSAKGNPKLHTLVELLAHMGLRLAIEAVPKPKRHRPPRRPSTKRAA